MKQLIFLLTFILIATTASAKTVYVSLNGNGNGSSWSQATSLSAAAQMATHGDQIWVSSATYFPTQGVDRTASFQFAAGISLYGGFQGTETSISQRPAGATSILSGNIGDKSSSKDNSYTVLLLTHPSNQTVIDGFTIRDGAAKGYQDVKQPSTAGGALYIKGGQRPTISNCSFLNNVARHGGAVYIEGTTNGAAPVFNQCNFASNAADFQGGAVYNFAEQLISNPTFQSCQFSNNKSDYGAAILNNATNGSANPLVINCAFVNNYALTDGSVIFNLLDGNNGVANPVVNACQFENNGSPFGSEVSSSRNTASLEQPRNTGSRLTPVPAGR